MEVSGEEDSGSEEEIVKVPIAKDEPVATAQPVLKTHNEDSDEDDDDLTGWNN